MCAAFLYKDRRKRSVSWRGSLSWMSGHHLVCVTSILPSRQNQERRMWRRPLRKGSKQVERRMSQSEERQKVFMHILAYIHVAICVNYHYPLLLFSHSIWIDSTTFTFLFIFFIRRRRNYHQGAAAHHCSKTCRNHRQAGSSHSYRVCCLHFTSETCGYRGW